ncbi:MULTISPECIES: hypothetical protein [Paenibacillus]|uniref:hypothetical protein n=1 Tax=Paenibacillus TaxID=44249 RepID=UPI001B149552|nr:hypothetical protein [Paenibacillus lactis]GIO89576.1 hypothetical protein J31TS3_08030 [Paenibacillus lactis]
MPEIVEPDLGYICLLDEIVERAQEIKVEKGATDGRMLVSGDLEYKLDGWKENGIPQVRCVTAKFNYELQHNGTDWTVRNKMFYDNERRAEK